MNRIQWYYENIGKRDLLYKLNFVNVHQLPSIQNVFINVNTKATLIEKKKVLPLLTGLEIISGQKMKKTFAKKSIAAFKLRKGQILGAAGNLRKEKLYYFLEKLFCIVLPKNKDFLKIESSDNFISQKYKLCLIACPASAWQDKSSGLIATGSGDNTVRVFALGSDRGGAGGCVPLASGVDGDADVNCVRCASASSALLAAPCLLALRLCAFACVLCLSPAQRRVRLTCGLTCGLRADAGPAAALFARSQAAVVGRNKLGGVEGALRCTALSCAALRCAALRCGDVRCDAMRCCALCSDALLCCAVHGLQYSSTPVGP